MTQKPSPETTPETTRENDLIYYRQRYTVANYRFRSVITMCGRMRVDSDRKKKAFVLYNKARDFFSDEFFRQYGNAFVNIGVGADSFMLNLPNWYNG